jgi:ankyrin repeat protein
MTDYVDVLLHYGVGVNLNLPAKDNYYQTPLFRAVRYERTEIVKMLIEHGADLEWKDDLGDTPFLSAVAMNNFRMALLLLEYGADYKAVSDRGDNVVFLLETSSADSSATQYEWKLKLAKILESKRLDIDMEKVRQAYCGPRWKSPMTKGQLEKGKMRRVEKGSADEF